MKRSFHEKRSYCSLKCQIFILWLFHFSVDTQERRGHQRRLASQARPTVQKGTEDPVRRGIEEDHPERWRYVLFFFFSYPLALCEYFL